jgi:hypothetical protein
MERRQHHAVAFRRHGRAASALDDWPASDETIHHYDDGDDEKEVNETTADVDDEETENPQDQQNYRDGPEHYGILARSELSVTLW